MGNPNFRRPKVDKVDIGFVPMNRRTHPGNFHDTEAERRTAQAETDRASANLERIMAEERAALAAGATAADAPEETSAGGPITESSGDQASEYVPSPERKKTAPKSKGKGKGKAPATAAPTAPAATSAPAVAAETEAEGKTETAISKLEGEGADIEGGEEADVPSDFEDDGTDTSDSAEDEDIKGVDEGLWEVGEPKTQPLAYEIHDGPNGEMKIRRLRFNVDFNKREDVDKANKTRRLEVGRAKKKFGWQHLLKRESMTARAYTQENDEAIAEIHHEYAANNEGAAVPWPVLTQTYNARFPTENRSQSTLYSRVSRSDELRQIRERYSGA